MSFLYQRVSENAAPSPGPEKGTVGELTLFTAKTPAQARNTNEIRSRHSRVGNSMPYLKSELASESWATLKRNALRLIFEIPNHYWSTARCIM